MAQASRTRGASGAGAGHGGSSNVGSSGGGSSTAAGSSGDGGSPRSIPLEISLPVVGAHAEAQDEEEDDDDDSQHHSHHHQHRHHQHHEHHVDELGASSSVEHVDRRRLMLGMVTVTVAVFGVASVGPLLDYIDHAGPFLKTGWRGMVYSTYLLPGLIWGLWKYPWSWSAVRWSFVAGAAFALQLGTFVVALEYTSIAHDVVFNNLTSIVLIFVKLVRRQHVYTFEYVGTAIGIVGAVLCSLDGTSMASDDLATNVMGNVITGIGSLGGAAYILISKQSHGRINTFAYAWFVHFSCGVIVFCLAFVLDPHTPSFADPYNRIYGVLGWMNPEPHRLYALLILGVTGCLFGQLAYVLSLSIVSPMVISLAMLSEPAASSTLGMFLGVELMPGPWTFIGGAILVVGVYCVVDPEARARSARKLRRRLVQYWHEHGFRTYEQL